MTVPTPEQIDAFEVTSTHIAVAIEGLTDEQMQHVPAANEWSINHPYVKETFSTCHCTSK